MAIIGLEKVFGGKTTPIHVGVWFGENNPFAVDLPLSIMSASLSPGKGDSVLSSQPLNGHEAKVVAGDPVSQPWIPQTDDELHPSLPASPSPASFSS